MAVTFRQQNQFKGLKIAVDLTLYSQILKLKANEHVSLDANPLVKSFQTFR